MLIRLGTLALTADPSRPALTDPMLCDAAWKVYREAPQGSAMELRGALVIVCLAAQEMMAPTVALAGAHRYEVGPLGGALWGLVKRAGGAPEDALAALASLYPPRAPAAPVAPPAAPVASAVTEEDRQRFGVVRAPPREVPAQVPEQASPAEQAPAKEG